MPVNDVTALIGIAYACLYMHKHYSTVTYGRRCITKSPEEMILKVWTALQLENYTEAKDMRQIKTIMENAISPIRRKYYASVEGRCYFSVGDIFRDGITKRQVSNVYEESGKIFVSHKCISPINDKVHTETEEKLFQFLVLK